MSEIFLHGRHDDVSFLLAELKKFKGFVLEVEERKDRSFTFRIISNKSFDDILAKLIFFVNGCFSNDEGFLVIKLNDFYVENFFERHNITNKYWSFKFVKDWKAIRVNFYENECQNINFLRKEIKKKIGEIR